MHKIIGKGSFGKVFLATNNVTGKEYAMKVIRKDLLIASKQLESPFREKEVLLNVNLFKLISSYRLNILSSSI